MTELLSHLGACGVDVKQEPVRRTGTTEPILSVHFGDPDMNLIVVPNRLLA